MNGAVSAVIAGLDPASINSQDGWRVKPAHDGWLLDIGVTSRRDGNRM